MSDTMNDDLDDELRRLLRGELPAAPSMAAIPQPVIQLGPDGLPLDPAQTRAWDQQQQFQLQQGHLAGLQADERAREARRAERQELEQHWGQEVQAQALVAQYRQAQPAVQYHVHYHVGVPAYRPEPAYYPTTTYVPARSGRSEDWMILIAVVTCSLLALAVWWGIAVTFRYQGKQDAIRSAYDAPSTVSASEHHHP